MKSTIISINLEPNSRMEIEEIEFIRIHIHDNANKISENYYLELEISKQEYFKIKEIIRTLYSRIKSEIIHEYKPRSIDDQ